MRHLIGAVLLLAINAAARGQSIFEDPKPRTAQSSATVAPPPKPTVAQERQRAKQEKRDVAELDLIERRSIENSDIHND